MKKFIAKHGFSYVLLMPAALALVLIQLLPNLQGLYISMLNLNQFNFRKFFNAPFVGLKNYSDILFNPDSVIREGFFEAIRNSAIFTVAVIAGTIIIGLTLALILNQEFKGRGIARTLLLMPWVVPTYVVGVLGGVMTNSDGVINRLLMYFHIIDHPILWKAGPMALVTVVIITLWRFFPMAMLMYMAALQGISKDYYEAADIDGANQFQKFWYITVPFLKPITAMIVLYGLIQHIYSFNIASMMFGQGAGYAGVWGDLIMTNLVRNSFQQMQYGPGGAASVLLMVGVVAIVLIWLKTFKDVISSEE